LSGVFQGYRIGAGDAGRIHMNQETSTSLDEDQKLSLSRRSGNLSAGGLLPPGPAPTMILTIFLLMLPLSVSLLKDNESQMVQINRQISVVLNIRCFLAETSLLRARYSQASP
jgi:hypothetical protein